MLRSRAEVGRPASFVVEMLEDRRLLAAPGATLVQDLTPRDAGSAPQQIVAANGLGYLVTSETKAGTTTYSLDRTDGTEAGTSVLATFPGARPNYLTASGGLVYYEAPGAVRQVWRTDGSAAGTVALTAFTSAAVSTARYTDVSGTLYFVVSRGSGTPVELWKSEGTAETTVRVGPVGGFGSIPTLVNAGGTLFFAAAPPDDPADVELWKSDGTDAGTVRVKEIRGGSAASFPTMMAGLNGTLFFTADDGVNGRSLWKSDGTGAGTVLVKASNATPGQTSAPVFLTAAGDTLYYIAAMGSAGWLFKSDGTEAGTGPVKEINPSGLGLVHLVAYGDVLVFTAATTAGERELWKTDGTAAGTVQIADVAPGAASSSPADLIAFDGHVYFSADDGTRGRELWRTDGTAAGTVLVKDIAPTGSSSPASFAGITGAAGGSRLLFAADDGAHGAEPWVSDGTAAGTTMLRNVVATPIGTAQSIFVPVGNRVFFNGAGWLWVTDGTSAGTVRLAQTPIDSTGFVSVSGVNVDERYKGLPTTAVVGGVLYYRSHGRLWRTDGTVWGTALVSPVANNISCLAAVGDLLYFSAEDGVSGHELWRSDGTAGGTYRVVDLGTNSSLPRNITRLNDGMLFSSWYSLWKSDGTAAGTVQITPLPGSAGNGDTMYHFQRIGDHVYFTTIPDLWRTDGTAAGTIKLTSGQGLYIAQRTHVRRLGPSTYFLAAKNGVPGLYRTDGNTAGGAQLVKAIGTSTDLASQPGYNLVVAGGRLFFTGPNGTTLWTSDGTAAGTTSIGTFAAGTAELTPLDDRVYFTSDGRLFTTDGTAAGTVPVDNQPAPGLTLVKNLAAMDGALVFSAFHPLYDNELWVVDASPVAAPATPSDFSATAVSGGEVQLTWTDNAVGESWFQLERSRDTAFATVEMSVRLAPDRTFFNDRPLSTGVKYYYRLVATTRGGASAVVTASAVTLGAVPAVPGPITAQVPWDRLVQLSWLDNATDETGYVVQRARDADFRTVEATFALPANATSLNDTGTLSLQQYFYRVYATGIGGNSYYSSISVHTPDRAPAGLTAAAVSATRVDLRWTSAATTVGTFRIERAPGSPGSGAAFTQVKLVPGTQLNYSDLNVPPMSAWTYRVVAVGAAGSSRSEEVAATTPPPVLTTPVKPLPPVLDRSPSSRPTKVVVSNGVGYFVLDGGDLWRTDGTDAGTTLVKELSNVRELVDVNGTLYFLASDYATNLAIFKSDGTTAGTVLVKDIQPHSANTFIHDLISYKGKLYFRGVARHSNSDSLWSSDGTADGTVEVKRFGERNGGDIFRSMVVSNGRLWLGANDPVSNTPGLWVSDGTEAGTVAVTSSVDVVPTSANSFVAAGDVLYFSAIPGPSGTWTSWRSDGTPEGTYRLPGSFALRPGPVAAGDTFYTPAWESGAGLELYKFSPEYPNGVLVTDLNPGAGDSSPHALTPFGTGLAFFTSVGPTLGLYVTGGTGATTTPVKEFPIAAGAKVTDAYAFEGQLYFFVPESSARSLYRSDGTAAGTTFVKRFVGAGQPGQFAALGGVLTFTANDSVTGLELWKTDGTEAGTVVVKDIATRPLPSKPDSMVTLNGAAYFVYGSIGGTGRGAIYRTDGTDAGTSLVFDGQASGLFTAGDRIYFTAYTLETGTELWVTDGTVAGTHMVTDLVPGTTGSNPVPLAWLGDKLVFGVKEANGERYALWRTDGTAAGTAAVSDPVLLPEMFGKANPPAVLNGVMYFNGDDNGVGEQTSHQLWRTDGTAAGTYEVATVAPNADPNQFAVLGGTVYFYAFGSGTEWALWKTDGTAGGTAAVVPAQVSGLTAAGGALHFATPAGTYRSDGTAAGTTLLSGGAKGGRHFTAVGGLVYFLANDGLWKTDGTPGGTVRVREVAFASSQTYLLNANGLVFFSDGTALWRSGGTTAGTYQVINISDGSTAQANMVYAGALAAVLGDRLLFGAITPDGGRELRVAHGAPPAAPDTLAVAPPPPPAPSASSGGPAAAAATGVVLTWADRSTNESGFVIDRSTTPDFANIDAQFFVAPDTTTYTDTAASVGDRFFYRIRTFNAGGQSDASNSVTVAAPGLAGADFRWDLPAAHRLTLRFNADVGATLSAGDLQLRNLTSGTDVPAAGVQVTYDRTDNTAVVAFAGGALADGRYRLTLRAHDVASVTGLALDGDGDGVPGGDYAYDFFALTGDVNRDAAVDFNDLVVLAQNYNAAGKAYVQGDLTGDGLVDFNDLVMLAQRYNTALPVPAPGAAYAPSARVQSDGPAGTFAEAWATATAPQDQAPAAPVSVRSGRGRPTSRSATETTQPAASPDLTAPATLTNASPRAVEPPAKQVVTSPSPAPVFGVRKVSARGSYDLLR